MPENESSAPEWFDKFLEEVVQTTTYKDERLKSAYMSIAIGVRNIKEINASLLEDVAAKDEEIAELKKSQITGGRAELRSDIQIVQRFGGIIYLTLPNGEELRVHVCKDCGLEYRGEGITEDSLCPRCSKNVEIDQLKKRIDFALSALRAADRDIFDCHELAIKALAEGEE